jgi:hypothetical protein
MTDPDEVRIALRRETHDCNAALADLADRLDAVDGAAASAVKRARSALFEAWTILCVPPDDEDDH